MRSLISSLRDTEHQEDRGDGSRRRYEPRDRAAASSGMKDDGSFVGSGAGSYAGLGVNSLSDESDS